ncbi:MAG: hypothetical protein IPJ88_10355 [Myxococcales bacterium]|nr:MAG: hypothetical protein IPJ88_10355 [Myxococcales bacterium]
MSSDEQQILTLTSELKLPLMTLPIKMSLVRVGEKVVMISPLPDLERFKTEIDAFGVPTDIVAPNLFHSSGVEAAAELYPTARIWGVKGFARKRPQIAWQAVLGEGEWPFSQELSMFEIEGMPKFNEVVFLHRPSKTLIATDLCFNHLNGTGFGYWLVFNLFGTYRRFAVSRLFLKMVKNRESFNRSISQLLESDFENIIMAHGLNVTGSAKEKLVLALKEKLPAFSYP